MQASVVSSAKGEGNGNPLRCSCLENPRDGGAWWAAIYGVAQSQTPLKWLSSSSSSICQKVINSTALLGMLWGLKLLVPGLHNLETVDTLQGCLSVSRSTMSRNIAFTLETSLSLPYILFLGLSTFSWGNPRVQKRVSIHLRQRISFPPISLFGHDLPTPLICLQPSLAMCPMDNHLFVWAPGNCKLYDVCAFLIDITSMVVKKWIFLSLVSQSNTFSVPSTLLHVLSRLPLLTAGGCGMPSVFPITASGHSQYPKCSGGTTRLHEASVSLDRGHFFSIGIAGS